MLRTRSTARDREGPAWMGQALSSVLYYVRGYRSSGPNKPARDRTSTGWHRSSRSTPSPTLAHLQSALLFVQPITISASALPYLLHGKVITAGITPIHGFPLLHAAFIKDLLLRLAHTGAERSSLESLWIFRTAAFHGKDLADAKILLVVFGRSSGRLRTQAGSRVLKCGV